MNETLVRYKDKAMTYWNQLSKASKWIIAGTALLTIAASILLFTQLSKTEFATAYTDLTSSDAAAIAEYLEGQGIPYKFSSDGSAIGVPSKKVTDIKVKVESQNMIQNGSFGYGIFRDNLSSFGMTENQFNVLNVDAKAGEIQQLINAIEGVARSKVLLTLPEQSVFTRAETELATAAAVVTFKSGYPKDQRQIDTVYNLIQKSVPNLPLENITVSDQYNELMPTSRLGDGVDTKSMITQQLQIKNEYEADIRKNIQNFLGQILGGQERVVVSVVASLNFDQENRQERLFQPVNEVDQQGIERSVQEIQKSYVTEAGGEGGVVGTGSTDIPTYPGGDGSATTTSEEVERIVNYEINEITRSIVASPYVVKDLTIFAGIEPPDPNNPDSFTSDTREEIQRVLVNIISASLADSGRDWTREEMQDKVVVMSRNFGTNTEQPVATFTARDYLIYGLIGLAVVALIGGGIYMAVARRKRLEQQAVEEIANSIPSTEVPQIDYDQVPNEHQVRKQLENLAHKKPEQFVNLLRTWLSEE